jgi:hypothetical protein
VSDDIVCILIDVFGIDCRTLPGKKDIGKDIGKKVFKAENQESYILS